MHPAEDSKSNKIVNPCCRLESTLIFFPSIEHGQIQINLFLTQFFHAHTRLFNSITGDALTLTKKKREFEIV